MQIECWTGPDDRRTITAPTPSAAAVAGLNTAIDEVRRGAAGEDPIAFELASPVGAVVRGAARLVLGLGAVVVTTLLMALVVVGAETRTTLLVVIAAVAVGGGLFVFVVWRRDVRLVLHRDGQLQRAGWGGVVEVDVGRYERVTVTPG